jgi:hypothetical protein
MTADVTKPNELKFMGRTYKIIFPDKIEDDNLGLTSHSKFLVKVKSKQIPLEEADTLIHEVLHVIWYHMGLCADNSDDVEERFVRTLATGLVCTFLENEKLLTYLKETLHADRSN